MTTNYSPDAFGEFMDNGIAVRTIASEQDLKSRIRSANENDLDRLVEIDLMMFEHAYGIQTPNPEDVREMLESRLMNIQDGGGVMNVCEVNGEVNGFCTYFRTSKPWEEFTTWEDTTNEGTLNGVVDREGRYGYVVNMTVTPQGSAVRGMQKIMAHTIAHAMRSGVEYGYFVSRVPEFTKWLDAIGIDHKVTPQEKLDILAAEYVEKTAVSRKGRVEPYDYELRTYSRAGFEMGQLVTGGFSDEESLNYGVTFKVDVPLANMPKPIRAMAAGVVCLAARSTKLMDKLF